jgi:AcrR family transcriptional regulator
MNKNESRYQSTAILFDEALINLLEHKDIDYITIKEICYKAGVNRSTFYLHYENISDLINECMEYVNKKFLSKFEQDTSIFIEKINESELDELYLIKSEYLIPYLNFIKENKNIFKATFLNPNGMQASKRMISLEKYVIFPIMKRYEIPEEKTKYILSFYLHGIVAIIKEWVKNDCYETIEEIENIIIECVKK